LRDRDFAPSVTEGRGPSYPDALMSGRLPRGASARPIRNDVDLKRVFRRLEKIFQAEEGTVRADERDVLVTLVEA